MSWSRLRWRMRGAWLWPSVIVLTPAGGLVLQELPFYGDGPGSVAAGTLIAGFVNLLAIAIVAPLVGRLVRRRLPGLPPAIANDYAGTVLVALVFAGFVAGGLVHRPIVRAAQEDRAELAAAVRRYVRAQAPEREPYLDQADSIQLDDDYHRACVPGPEPRDFLCLFVRTDQRPAGVTLDGDEIPNSAYRGL